MLHPRVCVLHLRAWRMHDAPGPAAGSQEAAWPWAVAAWAASASSSGPVALRPTHGSHNIADSCETGPLAEPHAARRCRDLPLAWAHHSQVLTGCGAVGDTFSGLPAAVAACCSVHCRRPARACLQASAGAPMLVASGARIGQSAGQRDCGPPACAASALQRTGALLTARRRANCSSAASWRPCWPPGTFVGRGQSVGGAC